LSMQRSGTTTFCGILNSWGIPCAYELFNNGRGNAGRGFSRQLGVSWDWVHQHPYAYLQRSRNLAFEIASREEGDLPGMPSYHHLNHSFRGKAPCLFVFKLFNGHLSWDSMNVLMPLVDAILIFRRANTTAQYLSYKYAMTTGCWETTPAMQAIAPQCQQPKDYTLHDDWPDFRHGADRWFDQAAALAAHSGKPTMRMEMESYLQAQPWLQVLMQSTLGAAPNVGTLAAVVNAAVSHRPHGTTCESWCLEHSATWAEKCRWNTGNCAGCESCRWSALYQQNH